METFLTIRDEQVPVKVVVNKRSRRMILRVDQRARVVKVTSPSRLMLLRVSSFVKDNLPWIHKQLPPLPPPVEDNYQFPILGRVTTLHLDAHGPRLLHQEDHLYCRSSVPHLAVPRYLKKFLLDYLEEHLPPLATSIGKEVTNIRLREARSRWGSCSPDGDLMFHWRLVFAPPEVVQYLMAHEASHLVHPNHSDDFWKLVEKLMPDYAYWRYWLKKNGNTLYAYFP